MHWTWSGDLLFTPGSAGLIWVSSKEKMHLLMLECKLLLPTLSSNRPSPGSLLPKQTLTPLCLTFPRIRATVACGKRNLLSIPNSSGRLVFCDLGLLFYHIQVSAHCCYFYKRWQYIRASFKSVPTEAGAKNSCGRGPGAGNEREKGREKARPQRDPMPAKGQGSGG